MFVQTTTYTPQYKHCFYVSNVQVTAAYPGELFSLGIRALDEIGRPTSDIIRITDLKKVLLIESPGVCFYCVYTL